MSRSSWSPSRSHPHAIGQVAGHDRARRLRQQHLPAAPDGGDSRGTYDVEPGIALVTDRRLAGVQAEPHTDRYALRPRLVLVRALDLDSRRHRVARARERVEEGVALRVDLLPVMRPERLAHDAPMGGKHLGVSSRRPGASSSVVLPSMSLNTNVTVPDGRFGMAP